MEDTKNIFVLYYSKCYLIVKTTLNMSKSNPSDIIHSPEMNNNGSNKTTDSKQPDQQCFLERLANHICRHYNWIIVLMLTPISLSYDFYCFGKDTSVT